jgi:polysaccharide pyruvyl transferase WcaK-like protein
VFLNQISRLRLLVSGRFHACTLAISAGTPFVAISSNTRKIASLVEDAGLDSWRIGVPFEPLAISAAAEHGWSRCERSNISDYLTRTRQAVETLIGDLRSLAQ